MGLFMDNLLHCTGSLGKNSEIQEMGLLTDKNTLHDKTLGATKLNLSENLSNEKSS